MQGKRPPSALVFIALMAIAAVIAGVDAYATGKNIHHGIHVGPYDVGSMSKVEAERFIRSKALAFLARDINLKIGTLAFQSSPKNIGAVIDPGAAAASAFAYSQKAPVYERLLLWVLPKKLPIAISFDKRSFNAFSAKRAEIVSAKPINFGIRIENAKPLIVEGANGRNIDIKRLTIKLQSAIENQGLKHIELPMTAKRPAIQLPAALTALRTAQSALSGPVTLTASGNKNLSINTDLLAGFIIVKEDSAKGKIFIDYDTGKIKEWLSGQLQDVTRKPVPAGFEVKGASVNIIPSQSGVEVEIDKTVAELRKAVASSANRSAFVELHNIEPELTTAKAQSMGIQERIGTFTTNYDPSATNRVHNIHLLASGLDGCIVAPNEDFSFNERLGPRTAERGFQEAPMILNGELVPALGGGVCQVGTTLFNAVFFTGLHVVERHNHSFYISHYPAGRDATVSYGSVDFKFRNDSGHHVMIKAWTTPCTLTIAIYGTSFGAEVAFTQTAFSNFRDFSRKDVPDPALDIGTEKTEDKGISGRDITVRRTVKVNGKIFHNDTFFSRYLPKKQIVRVGVRPAQQAPPAMPGAEMATSSLPTAESMATR